MNEYNNQPSCSHQERSQRHSGGRYLTKEERLRRKRKRHRQIMIQRGVLVGAAWAILIIIVVLILKGCSGGIDALAGKWNFDGSTYYEFDGDGAGTMTLPNKTYEFSYKVKDNQMRIDYEDASLTDGTYTFSVEDSKLTLIGGEGTVGGTYELTKVNNP